MFNMKKKFQFVQETRKVTIKDAEGNRLIIFIFSKFFWPTNGKHVQEILSYRRKNSNRVNRG